MTYNPWLLFALVAGETAGVLAFEAPSGAAGLPAEEGGCC